MVQKKGKLKVFLCMNICIGLTKCLSVSLFPTIVTLPEAPKDQGHVK